MKLINLDEVKCFVITDINDEPIFKFKIGEGMPIVEAIPIEWIKKWKEKAANGSLYRGPLDLYDHYEYEAAIDRLLSDWEEENEKV